MATEAELQLQNSHFQNDLAKRKNKTARWGGSERREGMAKSNVGKVYCGKTKYIDPETKKQRNYVIVRDNGKTIFVAKLKSIKKERFKLSSHDTYNAIVHARIQKKEKAEVKNLGAKG